MTKAAPKAMQKAVKRISQRNSSILWSHTIGTIRFLDHISSPHAWTQPRTDARCTALALSLVRARFLSNPLPHSLDDFMLMAS